MAAPLPTGANLSVFPQAPTVNPQALVNDPNAASNAINTGLDLGQRLLRLKDIGTQIELEQSRRKSEMAQLAHAKLLAEHETSIIPQEIARRVAEAKAATVTADNASTYQGSLAGLNVPSTLAGTTAMGANTDQQIAQARGQAVNQSLASVPAPAAISNAQAASSPANAASVLPPELTPSSPGLLDATLAQGRKSLVLQGKGPFFTNADLKQTLGINTKSTEFVDPKTQAKYTTQVTYGPNQEILESTPPVLTSAAPAEKLRLERQPEIDDVVNLTSQVDDAIKTVEDYKTKAKNLPFYQKGAIEGAILGSAGKPVNGAISGYTRSVAQAATEQYAQQTTAKLGALRELFSSGSRKDEIKNLANRIGPASDISNPDKILTDLNGVKDSLSSRLKSLQSPGTSSSSHAKAGPADGTVRYKGTTPYKFSASSNQWLPVQ